MALPTPSSPISIPTFTEDRGAQQIDPKTKSSLTKPVSFTVENVCGDEAYTKFQVSMNVNELTEDCELVQAANISIKGQVPHPLQIGDVNAIIGAAQGALVDALT